MNLLAFIFMSELTQLLSGGSSSLFEGEAFKAPKPPTPPPSPPQKVVIPREPRTLFIGNVPIATKRKDIKELLEHYGEVEKVWSRSVPVERGKLPIKAAVALKKFKEDADTCNFYALMATEEQAQKALELNNKELNGKHIRVDLAEQPKKDPKKSVFIGNLSYYAKEEELREEFAEFGDIDYVRIIKDPQTHLGKGFGYVAFKEASAAKRALAKNNLLFKDRPLRVTKAKDQKELQKPPKRSSNPFFNAKALKTQAELYDDTLNSQTPKKRPRSELKKQVLSQQEKLKRAKKQRREHNKQKASTKKKSN